MQVGVACCCTLMLSIHKEIANFIFKFFKFYFIREREREREREYVKIKACFVLEIFYS